MVAYHCSNLGRAIWLLTKVGTLEERHGCIPLFELGESDLVTNESWNCGRAIWLHTIVRAWGERFGY